MDELLALLRKKQFAPSSEQTKPTEEQLGLFNEAEQENKPEPKEPIKKDARGYHVLQRHRILLLLLQRLSIQLVLSIMISLYSLYLSSNNFSLSGDRFNQHNLNKRHK